MRLLVIAPPDFAPLELLRREAPDVELIAGTDAEALRHRASCFGVRRRQSPLSSAQRELRRRRLLSPH